MTPKTKTLRGIVVKRQVLPKGKTWGCAFMRDEGEAGEGLISKTAAAVASQRRRVGQQWQGAA